MNKDNNTQQVPMLQTDLVQISRRERPNSESHEILILSRHSRQLCSISCFPIFLQHSPWTHYAEETLCAPVENAHLEEGKLILEGSTDDHASARWQIRDEISAEHNVVTIRRQWTYSGERLGGVRLGFDLFCHFTDLDYWMIPGLMYNGNPGAHYQPAGMLEEGEPWCFREERTTVPSCLILESQDDVLGAFTEPARDEALSSFCSLAPANGGHTMRLGFPFIEAPLTYMGDRTPDDKGIYVRPSWTAKRPLVVESGDTFERNFYLVVDTRAERLHGYVRVLDAAWKIIGDDTRGCYDLDGLHEICWKALSYHWYEDERMSGYSTRISADGAPEKSRSPYFQAGWCGVGFLMGYLLLKEFQATGDSELLAKAKSTAASFVNHSGLPNGMYLTIYDFVKREFAHEVCTTLQMAEGVYWLLKMNELLSQIEEADETWGEFARRFCDFLVRSQLPTGSFGEKWRPSGELIADYRCGGVFAVATLAEAFKAFDDRRYLEAAEKGARYFIESCVDAEENYGICTDLSNTAIEMDGNDAVVFALLELHEVTKDPLYLEKAIKAAEFGLSFQYVYNVAFAPRSDAGKYRLDTRGGALISNEIPFLGYWVAWGALGFLRIWEHTGDARWRERAVAAIKHSTHLLTTEEEPFGCAPHLVGCREEVLGVADIAKNGVFRKKGMVELADAEPVFWPAAFNLLNIMAIRENHPELIEEF